MRDTQNVSESPLDIFIEGWGRMGVHWGVGKVMGEIQALLYLSAGPLSLEEMSDRLKTSRSNISMNVRALQDLGVVKKVSVPGDRKDYYAAEEDVGRVARRLAAEKKRRELDPALDIVKRAVSATDGAEQDSNGDEAIRTERLLELKDLIETIAGIFEAFIDRDLADTDAAATLKTQPW
jgi:DNA-binding transcriptional regulator GbsR (MarR family)